MSKTIAILAILLAAATAFGQTSRPTISLPADAAERLGIVIEPPATVEVAVADVAAATGFRLYDGISRIDLSNLAGFDPQPIRFLAQHQFGLYPRIEGGEPLHGGTPIGVDLNAHRNTMRRQVAELDLPPGTLVAIDYEIWGPDLPEADGPHAAYRELALQQTAAALPGLEGECLEAAARALWRRRAVEFCLATLEAAREARPDLLYGYYHPQARHFWSGAYEGEAAGDRRAENDLFADVWASVDWFPVSTYQFYPTTEPNADGNIPSGYASAEANARYVRSNVAEFVRLAGGPDDPRLLIAMIEPAIHASNRSLPADHDRQVNAADYRLWLDAAAEGGADGLMIWGWSNAGKSIPGHRKAASVYGPVFGEFVAKRAVTAGE